jgi:hypothetical protein
MVDKYFGGRLPAEPDSRDAADDELLSMVSALRGSYEAAIWSPSAPRTPWTRSSR